MSVWTDELQLHIHMCYFCCCCCCFYRPCVLKHLPLINRENIVCVCMSIGIQWTEAWLLLFTWMCCTHICICRHLHMCMCYSLDQRHCDSSELMHMCVACMYDSSIFKYVNMCMCIYKAIHNCCFIIYCRHYCYSHYHVLTRTHGHTPMHTRICK